MAVTEQETAVSEPEIDLRGLDIGNDEELRRKQKVVSFTDLPGVPEGTPGKVLLVQGFDRWIRYRVLFDNGVNMGSIDRAYLAPAKRYQELVRRREEAIEAGEHLEEEQDEVAGEDAAAGAAGEGKVVNGVTVPPHLLDRSKRARERLSA